MTADPYSPRVRELFATPRHAGVVDGGKRARRDAQGVMLELTMQCVGGRIQALRFRAFGCPHLIAAAEAFCRAYEGGPESALIDYSAASVVRDLAVPIEKTGRILVLEDAVRALGP